MASALGLLVVFALIPVPLSLFLPHRTLILIKMWIFTNTDVPKAENTTTRQEPSVAIPQYKTEVLLLVRSNHMLHL